MKQDWLQRWQQVDALFEQHEQLTAEEALRMCSQACPSTESLLPNLDALLEHVFSSLKTGTVQGNYRIEQRLFTGGQSEVYLAERADGLYQKQVVIKLLSQQYESEALRQQFLGEMQLLAGLRHPGVVTLLDGGLSDEGRPWLVLEYIKGPALDVYVHEQHPPAENLIKILIRICDALSYIHQKGILHKDIKPSNILLQHAESSTPWPVLIDFGISSMAGEQSSKLIFVTRGFSPPEQLAGEDLVQASDLYALGMTMGYLLTGCQPLDTDQPRKKLLKALQKNGVDAELIQIVTHCTRRDVAQRYQDAESLRSDLYNWLHGHTISLNSQRMGHVLNKLVQRNKKQAIALFVLLVASITAAWQYTHNIQQLQQQTEREKNARDQLLNFMLNELFTKLKPIGRVDLLQEVAEKSMDTLSAQHSLTDNDNSRVQNARALFNVAHVYDALNQHAKALTALQQAEALLTSMVSGPLRQAQIDTLAQLHLFHAKVLSRMGAESDAIQQQLAQAAHFAQQLLPLDTQQAALMQWKIDLEQLYFFMEYGRVHEVSPVLQRILQQANSHSAAPGEQKALLVSESYQALAWYEHDFGEKTKAMHYLEQALQVAESLAKQSTDQDIKLLWHLLNLHNHMAFFLLDTTLAQGKKQARRGLKHTDRAIELARELEMRAPLNRQYQRELSFSLTYNYMLLKALGQWEDAARSLEQSIAISKKLWQQDPGNLSAANDLAIDLANLAHLYRLMKSQNESTALLLQALELAEQAHNQAPENKYYAHTLLSVRLYLDQTDHLQPLIRQVQEGGLLDASLMKQLQLKAVQMYTEARQ